MSEDRLGRYEGRVRDIVGSRHRYKKDYRKYSVRELRRGREGVRRWGEVRSTASAAVD